MAIQFEHWSWSTPKRVLRKTNSQHCNVNPSREDGNGLKIVGNERRVTSKCWRFNNNNINWSCFRRAPIQINQDSNQWLWMLAVSFAYSWNLSNRISWNWYTVIVDKHDQQFLLPQSNVLTCFFGYRQLPTIVGFPFWISAWDLCHNQVKVCITLLR